MKFLRVISISVNALLLVLGISICLGVDFFRTGVPTNDDLGLSVSAFITCFLLFLIVVNEVISMLRISDSTYHTVLVSGTLMLYYFFSPDSLVLYGAKGLEGSLTGSEVGTTIFFFAGILSIFLFASFTYGSKAIKIPMLPMLVIAVVTGGLYIGLSFINLQIIAYAIFAACAIGYYAYIFISCVKAKIDNPTFHYTSYILFALLGMHGVNVLHYSGIVSNVNWWSSGYLWTALLAFVLIYFNFALMTSNQVDQLQKQADSLKANAFMGQYRPNFVNSSFTAIEEAYHHSLEDGDKALHLFSQYMNDSTWMLDKGLVSFEKECEFATNYIDFCNIGNQNPIKLEFHVSYNDFVVPSLSLQPYLENAIKQNKKDGKGSEKIVISAAQNENDVLLTISGIGTGSNIKSSKFGSGIANSKERFRILLKAETRIKSDGDNILVSIRIPCSQKEEPKANP